jgi:putative methionine-R-sulfoxide reductase with GAF domain
MYESLTYHWHIRWSRPSPLDFEPFGSPQEADSCAYQMVRPGESYSIEKFDRDCIRCKVPSKDSLSQVLALTIRKAMANFGGLWILNKDDGTLRMVAQQGFSPSFLQLFVLVEEGFAACGTTVQREESVLVNDVATDPIFVGKSLREIMRREGARSVQSVPLFTSVGHLVGVIAVHYRACGMPSLSAYQLELRHVRDVADHVEQFARGPYPV